MCIYIYICTYIYTYIYIYIRISLKKVTGRSQHASKGGPNPNSSPVRARLDAVLKKKRTRLNSGLLGRILSKLSFIIVIH